MRIHLNHSKSQYNITICFSHLTMPVPINYSRPTSMTVKIVKMIKMLISIWGVGCDQAVKTFNRGWNQIKIEKKTQWENKDKSTTTQQNDRFESAMCVNWNRSTIHFFALSDYVIGMFFINSKICITKEVPNIHHQKFNR